MGKRLYVGSLPFQTTEPQLAEMFSACGTVASAKIIADKLTGRSKGFGFVEMGTDAEADVAKEKMNGFAIGDRKIVVNEARPMEDRKSNAPSNGNGRRSSGGSGGNGFSGPRNNGFNQSRPNSWGGGGQRSGNGQGDSRGSYNPNRNNGGGYRDSNKNGGYQGGYRDTGGFNRPGIAGGYTGRNDNGGFTSRGDNGMGVRRDAGRRKSWGDRDSRRQGQGQGGGNRPPMDDNFGNR